MRRIFKLILVVLVVQNTLSTGLAFSQNAPKTSELLKKYRINGESLTLKELYVVGVYYFKNDSLKKSMDIIDKALLRIEEKKIDSLELEFKILKGYIFFNWGSYSRAIVEFSNLKKRSFELNDTNKIITSYHGLSRIHHELGQLDEAFKDIKEGLKLSKLVGNKMAEGELNNVKGMVYHSRKEYYKSIEAYKVYLSISKERDDTITMTYALINIGECFIILEKYDSSLYYFDLAAKMNRYKKDPQATSAIFGNKAKILSKQGRYHESNQLLKYSMPISREQNFTKFLKNDYITLVDNFKGMGDYANAMKYQEELLHFTDSMASADHVKQMDYMAANFEYEKQLSEAKIVEQKLKIRTLLMVIFLSIGVFTVISLILLNSRYKLRTKLYQQEKKQLTLTIDEKNRELISKVIETNNKNNIYDELSQVVGLIKSEMRDDDKVERLNLLMRKIKTNDTLNLNWESFKSQFEQVHPEFFKKLHDMNLSFTTTELRMCAYIKMNLSTKEIAYLMNVGERAVQTSRYRLKKKFNLDKSVDLVSFISRL